MTDTAKLEALVNRLEAVTLKLEGGAGPAAAAPSAPAAAAPVQPAASGSSAAFVTAYDGLVKSHLQPWMDLCSKIGGEVLLQAEAVQKCFTEQRKFLEIAAVSKKPKMTTFQELLKPTSEGIAAVQSFANGPRGDFFNHVSFVKEAVAALGWVCVEPTPAPYVKDMLDAGEFYGNKVLVQYKTQDPTHVEWVKAAKALFTELSAYVKAHHTTGVSWNPQGGDAAAAAPAAAPAGGPPAPPGPPPPAPDLSGVAASAAPAAGAGPDTSALFAALSKGDGVTKGLRKVTDDMKTKNRPAEERRAVVPSKPSSGASATAAAKKPVVTKPPMLELDGSKWRVENQVDNSSIVIEDTNSKQQVYIYNCMGKASRTVIQIKGKVNAIMLDKCKKTSVVFEDAISSVELVNCESIELQWTGRCPTVAIDKTAGCIVYVSPQSLDVSLLTSNHSEINVVLPSEDPSKDPVEVPIPEQFITKIDGGKLTTTQVEHSSA